MCPDESGAGDCAGAEDAYRCLEMLRWGAEPRCPHCAATDRCSLVRARASDGVRRTRTGSITYRRIWNCGRCRRQFSVLTGTVLAGTRVPLPVWVAVLHASGRQPASASDIAATHGISHESALRMLRRVAAVRNHLGADEVPAADFTGPAFMQAALRLAQPQVTAVRHASPATRPRARSGRTGPSVDYGGQLHEPGP